MPGKSFINGDTWLQWLEAAVTSGSCSLFFAGFYFLAGGCQHYIILQLFEWL